MMNVGDFEVINDPVPTGILIVCDDNRAILARIFTYDYGIAVEFLIISVLGIANQRKGKEEVEKKYVLE